MGKRRGQKISREDRDLHKRILTRYFDLQRYMRVVSTEPDESIIRNRPPSADGSKGPSPEAQRSTASNLWALLQRAHIFEFSEEQFQAIRHEADVYTTEEICGVPWAPKGAEVERELEQGEYEKKVHDAGALVPFPEPLPFSTMWVAWGSGVETSRVTTTGETRMKLLGFLITTEPAPQVIELMQVGIDRQDAITYVPVPALGGLWDLKDDIRHPQDPKKATWSFPLSLAPWVVKSTIDAINANETYVEGRLSGLWEREMAKKWTKRFKQHLVPPPYYRVTVKPKHVVEQLRESPVRKEIEYSHRWDCRGNYACRVLRGPLATLTDEVREKLRKRKYDVWTAVRRPDATALEILTKKRQLPPRAGEWVATRRWWRKASVKGPADRPYIPSTRKLAGMRGSG